MFMTWAYSYRQKDSCLRRLLKYYDGDCSIFTRLFIGMVPILQKLIWQESEHRRALFCNHMWKLNTWRAAPAQDGNCPATCNISCSGISLNIHIICLPSLLHPEKKIQYGIALLRRWTHFHSETHRLCQGKRNFTHKHYKYRWSSSIFHYELYLLPVTGFFIVSHSFCNT